jgi:hypothetical protein
MPKLLILLAILAGTLPHTARAEMATHLLRVECLPELSQIFITRQEAWGMHNVSREKIQAAISKHNLILPYKFDETCQLGNATYRIWGEQPSRVAGPCSANPPITLSVSRNASLLIDSVNFKENCYANRVSVNAIEISEEKKQLLGELAGEGVFLKHIKASVKNATPITQMQLDCKNPQNWDELSCEH